MTTKPLDLTKPVQTRSGHPARIICTDRVHPHYPVVALVLFGGDEVARTLTATGHYRLHDSNVDDPDDLINVPPKVVDRRFYNVHGTGALVRNYFTQEAAEATDELLGQIKVTTYDDGTFTIEKSED